VPHTLKPAEIPDRSYTTWAERMLALGLVILLGLCVWLAVNAQQAKQRGFVNRAEACRVQVLLGAKLSPGCKAPEVLERFDPDEPPTAGVNSAGQQANRQLLCDLVRAHGMTSPVCEG